VGVARAVTYVGKLAVVHPLEFLIPKLVHRTHTSVQLLLAMDVVKMGRAVLSVVVGQQVLQRGRR